MEPEPIYKPLKARLYPKNEKGVHAVRPIRYKLKFNPNILDETFESITEIDIKVTEDEKENLIDHIVFNSRGLKYKSITLTSLDYDVIIPDNLVGITYGADEYVDETYKVKFQQEDSESVFVFKSGTYRIKFEYSGIFTKSENGIYTCSDRRYQHKISQYQQSKVNHDLTEEEKNILENEYIENTIICTEFEPAACRTIMPCFDEPIFKSIFEVSVNVTHSSHTAISNSKVKSVEQWEGGSWYNFYETPYMSTYLLCLVIGKFDYIESCLSTSGAKVRVYTPSGRTKQGEYALSLTVRTLEFYEKFFGVPYPLEKLDIVSLHSMDVRAMENWGCITFNEPALLMDTDSTPTSIIIRNARTICHEVSHMWFGNLVTMEWWTDIWLNEGFARFAEFFALDALNPEYHILDQFFTEVFVDGILQDGSYKSHPIEVECTTPSNLRNIFDGIAYAKGSSLVRMINEYLGTEVFQTAIKHYINTNLYSNTQTCDLWKVFEDTSKDENFTSMMKLWTQQKGFPIVSADLISTNDSCQTWRLSQKSCHEEDSEIKWIVPLSYITSKGTRGSIILREETQEFKLPIDKEEVVKFNDNSATFCLIKYGKNEIKSLLNKIDCFSIQNRMGFKNEIDYIYKSHVKFSHYSQLIMIYNLRDICVEERGNVYQLFTMFRKIIEKQYTSYSIGIITAGENDNLFKAFISNCTSKLFEKMNGLDVDPQNYLECQLIGLISQYQLLVLENKNEIEKCEAIVQKCLIQSCASDSQIDSLTINNSVCGSIQSDIRLNIYIGGVLSGNKDISYALFNYYLTGREELLEMGHFYEINNIITALLFSPYLFEFSHGALLKMDCSINDFLSFYAGGSILKAYFKFISENSSDLGLIDSASNVARELFAYVLRDGSLHYSPLSTDYLFFLLDKIDEIKETAKSTGFECENLIKFRYHIEISVQFKISNFTIENSKNSAFMTFCKTCMPEYISNELSKM